MENLSAIEWKKHLLMDSEAIVLDVRTPIEWAGGKVKGAIEINFNEQEKFIAFIKKLDLSKNYYVYCKSGVRSFYACQMMDSIGLKSYNLSDSSKFLFDNYKNGN